jgi:hypothetical protein
LVLTGFHSKRRGPKNARHTYCTPPQLTNSHRLFSSQAGKQQKVPLRSTQLSLAAQGWQSVPQWVSISQGAQTS